MHCLHEQSPNSAKTKRRCSTEVTKEMAPNVHEGMTEKGLIMALVDDSIGYYSYHGAAQQVEDFLAGESGSYSERGLACFKGDLTKEVEAAVSHWNRQSQQKKDALREFGEQLSKVKDWVTAATISMTYPTMRWPDASR